jgi:hypothetical protein
MCPGQTSAHAQFSKSSPFAHQPVVVVVTCVLPSLERRPFGVA